MSEVMEAVVGRYLVRFQAEWLLLDLYSISRSGVVRQLLSSEEQPSEGAGRAAFERLCDHLAEERELIMEDERESLDDLIAIDRVCEHLDI